MKPTMILVTTPTGNTGRWALQTLLEPQEPHEAVRVLVRDPAKLDPALRGHCEVIQGDLRDPADLARALAGVESAFFCVPQSVDPADVSAYYRSFAEPFAKAASASSVKRIVAISGGDGGETGQKGVGSALHEVEQTLNATGIAARYLRCGYFMENFFWMMQPIARAGLFSLPISGDVPIPFVAARDIGAAAARLLSDRNWTGQRGIAAHGCERLSCYSAAQILTEVLGFPVRFQAISGAEYRQSLAVHGLSDALSESLVEMFEAIADSRDMGAPAAETADCPTTLKQWLTAVFKPAVLKIHQTV